MKPRGSVFILLTFCVVFLISAVLAGCESEQQKSASLSQTSGVSDSEILIGSSCPLSGHVSVLGTQAIHGVQTYLNQVNDQGGVNGRHIRLIAYDDAYDPALCISNTQKLITEDRVFALTSYVGTPTAAKVVPMVQEAAIPLVGICSGARVLREPFQRYIINIRASYYEETGQMILHFVEDLGITRVAIFYQYDEFGFDGLAGTEIALQQHGLKPVAKASYIRGSMDVEEGVDLICGSDAEAVVMIGTYGPCAKFVSLAKQRKNAMIFHAVSLVGAEELAKILGPEAEGIIVTQVVPPPWETVLLPAASRYTRFLSRYFPEEKPSFTGFEGFLNAIVLVEGLKRAGRDITREGLIDAIEEQVFVNLVNNARDAMLDRRAGGHAGPNVLTIRSFSEQGHVRATVSDTGPGVPEAIRGRLFEPFFTTKETGKGTGLGLSISYGIVRDYKGTIDFTSGEGAGATFMVSFPEAPRE